MKAKKTKSLRFLYTVAAVMHQAEQIIGIFPPDPREKKKKETKKKRYHVSKKKKKRVDARNDTHAPSPTMKEGFFFSVSHRKNHPPGSRKQTERRKLSSSKYVQTLVFLVV